MNSLSTVVDLSEDFKVWKAGFVKELFPVLLGAGQMKPLAAGGVSGDGRSCEGVCECGKESSGSCSKSADSKDEEEVWIT